MVYSLRFGHDVFFGAPPDVPRTPHEPPRWMRVPMELLVMACLVVGVVPNLSVRWLLDAAARPVVGGTLPEYSLAIWHGFNAPLVMSLIAIVVGSDIRDVQCRMLLSGFCKHFFSQILFETMDNHTRAFRHTPEGDGLSDAGRASCNDDHFIL